MIYLTITDKKKNGENSTWQMKIKTKEEAPLIMTLFMHILALNGFSFEIEKLEVRN